jgi:hypothetical protein
MTPFDFVLNQTNRNWLVVQVSRGRGMNWLRFGATELLATRRRWTCSTSVEELEVEEWVDSLPLEAPPPPQASCDGGRGARMLQARELAGLRRRRAGEAHERRWPSRVGCGCRFWNLTHAHILIYDLWQASSWIQILTKQHMQGKSATSLHSKNLRVSERSKQGCIFFKTYSKSLHWLDLINKGDLFPTMLRCPLSTYMTKEYNYVDSYLYGCKPSFYRGRVKA